MAEAMEVGGELEWGDAYGVGGVQPYQFEPEAAEGEDGDPEAPDRGNQDRRSNRNWRYRYIAYRQLVRWCWGWLGREVRVVLPACAVTKIRDTFPSAQYTGFQYPPLN
ncbi:uncharacterized protein LOC144924409 isoform X1 [Branchiostoma floridae x Branchiostoma belcheri]